MSTDNLPVMDEWEMAFQVWALHADRGYTATSRILKDRFGIDLSPDAIRMRHNRNDWEGKALHLFSDIAPALFDRTRLALIAAGPPAATLLLIVVTGQRRADRGEIIAAASVLDRIGFLPHTRKDAERGHTPMLDTSTGTATSSLPLAHDELKAAIRDRLSSFVSED